MVRKAMGSGARNGYYDPESDEESDAGGAAASGDGFSSPPELPSDDDSDYQVSSSKKKSPKKKASPKKASSAKKKGPKKGQTPRGKISPAKTPASKRKTKQYNYESEELSEEEEEDEYYNPKKKAGRKAKPKAKRSLEYDYDSEDDKPPAKKAKKATKKASKAKAEETYSTKKKKAAMAARAAASSRSSGRSPAKKPVRYKDYDSDEDFDDDEDDQQNGDGDYDDDEVDQVSEDDYQPASSKKKKGGKKGASHSPAAKRGRGRPAAGGSSKKKLAKSSFYGDESESEPEEVSDDEPAYRPKKGKYLKAKQQKRKPPPPAPKYKLPPVSEMVVESIKALKDPPKKGSTLGSIKETILMNWTLNMDVYDKKIKKFIVNAIETGEVIRTKGTGFRGRFTVPGVKTRKKKRKNALGKKFDEDEVEYQPKVTERAEAKEKSAQELEQQREERRILEEQKLAEKANKPAKPRPVIDVNKEWEVEAIKGIREKKDGNTEYLVKWVGWPKTTWEAEENVEGCQDLINAYMIIKEKKEAEREAYRKLAEEEGSYEVAKIMNMRVRKGKGREFLVRWKGFGAEDDTWEPEEHLDCTELIAKCEQEFELIAATGGKARLREAPKPIDRLEYNSSKRLNKRGAFRISYAGMDMAD